MKNLLTLFIAFFIVNAAYAQSVEITPGSVLPQMTTAQRTAVSNPVNGMLVYDTNTNSYWFYQTNAWVQLANGGGSGFWQLSGLNGDEIKNTNSGGFWSANPVTVQTPVPNSQTVPIAGDGTRLMWIPSMSALRAGTVTNGRKAWDKDSVGFYSVALGVNVKATDFGDVAFGTLSKASGGTATAMGYETIASGSNSTSMGRSTKASGSNSTSMGNFAEASGDNSIAMGNFAEASGDESIAMGYSTTASDFYSTAMGRSTRASGQASTALGRDTFASHDYSTAMGRSTKASAVNSTATGYLTTASGLTSTAMGDQTFAKASGSFTIGEYNDDSDNPNGYSEALTDRLFQIGNGDDGSRSNAMTVLRNAKTGINTADPQAMLHVNGFTKLGDGAPAIKVKYLTGTTSSLEGGTVNISHDLNSTKIISVNVLVEPSSGLLIPPAYKRTPNYEFDYFISSSSLSVKNASNNSSSILSDSVKIVIMYVE